MSAAPVSDYQINARVRSVLARHWVDLHKIKFGSYKGTVRFHGELCHLGGTAFGVSDVSKVEAIESGIRSIAGVKRVHFELSHWRRSGSEGWEWSEKGEEDAARGASSSGGDPRTYEMKLKRKKKPTERDMT